MKTQNFNIHKRINLKGYDFTFPMGHKNRIVRLDRKAGYSLRGLLILDRMYPLCLPIGNK